MKKTFAFLALSLGVLVGSPQYPANAGSLQPVSINKSQSLNVAELGLDEQIWGQNGESGDRQALLNSIDNSLRYLQTPAAARNYPVDGITQNRALRSLQRFRELVASSRSPQELQAAVKREFTFYRSVGKDGKGTVLFTAYYQPVHLASRVPTAEYRYPLYRTPPNFQSWRSHPSRAQLEGADGLQGNKGRLRGLELVWLRDRLEAFLVQVQGSAKLKLTDGSEMTIGFGGATDYPYTSIGRELARDGKLPLSGLTIPVLTEYFQKNPRELDRYLPRNQRFVFFRETNGAPPTGSIGVPVTPERSIATDKSLMPPGALALVHTRLPFRNKEGKMDYRIVSRYVLDQDTGSAIRGPGRVDYFMGTGTEAGDRAGVTGNTGYLYYLVLKE